MKTGATASVFIGVLLNFAQGSSQGKDMAWMAKIIAGIAGALLIGLIVSFAWGRLRPLTAAQTQALALLTPAPAPPAGGPNAWATFWLLDYDVPAAQISEVYALERQHLQAWTQRSGADETSGAAYVNRVGQYFPKRPTLNADERKQLCRVADNDCLGKVRGNLQVLRDLVAGQAGSLAQIRAIPPDAVLWDDMPATAEAPIPSLGEIGNLRLTAAALDFIDGRQTQALTQVCRAASTVRHLHAHTNSLVGAMVADSWMDSIERLLAAMLSRLPAAQSIPADCAVAFAPVTRADIDMCAPLRREYLVSVSSFAAFDPAERPDLSRLKYLLLMDGAHTRAMIAPTYAWACQPQTIDDMQSDRPLSSAQTPVVRYDFFDAVSNPMGQMLARIAVPDYAKYLNRNEDFAAGLRMTAWLLATRATATTTSEWQRQLTASQATLQHGGSRQFQLDAAGRKLVMPYSAPRQHRTALILPLAQ